jgi:hypothetical protein
MVQNTANRSLKSVWFLVALMFGCSLAAANRTDDNEEFRRVRGYRLVKNAGVYTQFERRGTLSEYSGSGQVIQNWAQFDSVVGSTVSQEVSLQLDKMKTMGVNTITIELRTADPTYTGNFTPPDCNEPPVLGLQFPQPTETPAEPRAQRASPPMKTWT